jgi:Fanconi anemia group I protein
MEIRLKKEFISLIDAVAEFTGETFSFLPAWQIREADEALNALHEKKGKKRKRGDDADKTAKARIMRESRLVPTMVYVVEVFERQLLLLAKEAKVDLTRNFKKIAARDFRIEAQVMKQIEERSKEGDSDDDDDDDESKKKKKKKKKVKQEEEEEEEEEEGEPREEEEIEMDQDGEDEE